MWRWNLCYLPSWSYESRSADAPVPDAKAWTFSGSAGRRRQLPRWWPVVWWSTSPGDLLPSTVPKLRNLLTHFCTNLLPGASFSCWCFKLKFDRNRRLVCCSDVAKMHVSTQNVFSLIFDIVLHQVHWHLFCHLLYYPCAKNHKVGTCRLSARDDNLGVLLSGPPCMSRTGVSKAGEHWVFLFRIETALSNGKTLRCAGLRSALFKISSGLAWLGVWYGTRLHLALYRPDSRSVSDSYSGRLVSKLSSKLGFIGSKPCLAWIEARLGSAQASDRLGLDSRLGTRLGARFGSRHDSGSGTGSAFVWEPACEALLSAHLRAWFGLTRV